MKLQRRARLAAALRPSYFRNRSIEVTLDRHDEEIIETFGRSMANMPEVIEVFLTTGEYDYFVKVAVNDTSGYEEFLRKKLYKIPGIRHTRSSIALRCLKSVVSVLPDEAG